VVLDLVLIQMLLIVFGDLMEKLEIIKNLLILAVTDLFRWGE
jgi:hypothetical protein